MIPVSEFSAYLPHRDQGVWVDYVLSAKDNGGECLVKLDPTKNYFSDRGLRQTAFIEWMAQSFGFVNALHCRQNQSQQALEKAFLVAVEKMTFAEKLPVAGDDLIVSVKHVRSVGPISYVEGRVYSQKSDLTYCEAVIKLFSAQQ